MSISGTTNNGQASLWTRGLEVVLTIFAAKYLGHGRAMESFLACFAGSYGVALLFVPEAAFSSTSTEDIAWMGYGQLVALPFLAKSALTAYGLVGNIWDFPYSRQFRIVGASVGLWIWSTMILKFIWVGTPYTVGVFAAGWCFYHSVRVIALALANLPRPGHPGSL